MALKPVLSFNLIVTVQTKPQLFPETKLRIVMFLFTRGHISKVKSSVLHLAKIHVPSITPDCQVRSG